MYLQVQKRPLRVLSCFSQYLVLLSALGSLWRCCVYSRYFGWVSANMDFNNRDPVWTFYLWYKSQSTTHSSSEWAPTQSFITVAVDAQNSVSILSMPVFRNPLLITFFLLIICILHASIRLRQLQISQADLNFRSVSNSSFQDLQIILGVDNSNLLWFIASSVLF